MEKFMIAYFSGIQPSSQEEGMAHMGKWKAWVEGLGEQGHQSRNTVARFKNCHSNECER